MSKKWNNSVDYLITPNLTTKMSPISELQKTDTTFKWTTKCQNAFISPKKKELTSNPLVQPDCLQKR